MVDINTIRTIKVRYESEGADRARSDAEAVASSHANLATQTERAAVVTEQASRRQLSAASSYERLRAQVDETYRAQQRFERGVTVLDRALQQGVVDATGYDRTLGQLQARYGGLTSAAERAATAQHSIGAMWKDLSSQGAAASRQIEVERARVDANLEASRRLGSLGPAAPRAANENDGPALRRGLDSNQRRDLMYQSSDVVASLGSGAGLGTVAFQQGPQILQGLAAGEGGLRGGLKALGESALGLVTPMTVAGTAVAALGTAMAVAAFQAATDREVLEKATMGIGRATGATVGQLDALARANAEAGKVSASTAREIVAGYAQGGKIALPVIGDLTRATAEYARVTGQEVPAATAELAGMFADPARGADELATKIGGLDDRTRQLIQTQIEQGDRSAAQQTLAESLKTSIDANANATTGWAAAWNTAATAAAGYWEQAKRIAGLKLGIVPEGAQEALARTERDLANLNNIRAFTGQGPAELGSKARRERDAAFIVADTERRQAEAEAAQARAEQASRTAGQIARAVDPNFARLSTLRQQQSDLRDALADPLARRGLSDFGQTESAFLGVTRAIESMTDANGKLITSEEMARRQDQLRLDSIKAKTAAEKMAVAERQKAFDLIGKTIEPGDARGQIGRAGQIALASESAKGGGKSEADSRDDFDRAVRSLEDRLRRQQQEAQTYGMGAEAAARYRVETDLLTAAKRAERDITPALTAEIQAHADKAATAAAAQEKLRDSMREMDDLRAGGRDVFGGMFRDLTNGTNAANTFANALGRIIDRLSSIATDNLTDALFGKRGSSDLGLLGGLSGGGGLGGFLGSMVGGGSSSGWGGLPMTGGEWFANGGVMTSRGRMPLNAYAGGGVAHSPQVAIFGEGSMPEAYVPLPDGRSIPVTVQAPANANAPVQAAHMEVAVINNTGQPVERRTTNGPRGPREEIIIGKAVGNALSSGEVDDIMRRRYGLKAVG
ncbi:hypothetical protein GU700_10965 [Methylobacterium sp. NI91]|nr:MULTISPECIES: phage tail length tape measure family protein [unclassified Methylobacterium]QIJ75064.1 hypothetical protein CLZ_10965 [Methylobacterium sp. CLZ]QIJ79968.1 hypothetical protein GU700_10965 [Methylobacterium sp. NI91]